MSLLLRVTRPRTPAWEEWEEAGPVGRKTQAYTMLYAPMIVATQLAHTPPAQSLVELRTMPPLFFARLCCLACEQLSDRPCPGPGGPAEAMTGTAVHPEAENFTLTLPQTAQAAASTRLSAGSASNLSLSHSMPGSSSHQSSSVSQAVAGAAATAAALRELEIQLPDSRPVLRQRFASNHHLFIWLVAAAMGQLVSEISEMFGTQDAVRLPLFTHTSVIQLLEASLMLPAGVRDSDIKMISSEHDIIELLTCVIAQTSQINKAAQQAGAESSGFKGAAEGVPGNDPRPCVLVSDRRFLLTLCRRARQARPNGAEAYAVAQYTLIGTVLESWPKQDMPGLPFPPPEAEEQVCSIVPIMHDFSSEVLLWLLEQQCRRQWQQQPQQQKQQQQQRQQQQQLQEQQDMSGMQTQEGGAIQTSWFAAIANGLAVSCVHARMGLVQSAKEGEQTARLFIQSCSVGCCK